MHRLATHVICRLALGLAAVVCVAFPASAAAPDYEAEAVFIRRVAPVFNEKCLACHGNDEQKIKGDFDMRTLAGLLKGGESEKNRPSSLGSPTKARSTSPSRARTRTSRCRRRRRISSPPNKWAGSSSGSPAAHLGLTNAGEGTHQGQRGPNVERGWRAGED